MVGDDIFRAAKDLVDFTKEKYNISNVKHFTCPYFRRLVEAVEREEIRRKNVAEIVEWDKQKFRDIT